MAGGAIIDVLAFTTAWVGFVYSLQSLCAHLVMAASMHFEFPAFLYGMGSLIGWGMAALAKKNVHRQHGNDCCKSTATGIDTITPFAVAFNFLHFYFLFRVSLTVMHVRHMVCVFTFFAPMVYTVVAKMAPMWTGQSLDQKSGMVSLWVANFVIFIVSVLLEGLVDLTATMALFGFVQTIVFAVAMVFVQAAVKGHNDVNVLQKGVALPSNHIDAVFTDPVLAHVLNDVFKYTFVCSVLLNCLEDDLYNIYDFMTQHVLSTWPVTWLLVCQLILIITMTIWVLFTLLRRGVGMHTIIILQLAGMVLGQLFLTHWFQLLSELNAVSSSCIFHPMLFYAVFKFVRWIGAAAC